MAVAERLQKILANTGLGSRRELERWITNGDVRLNGARAQLGDRASLNDELLIRGRFYRVVSDDRDTRRVLAYHKPLGEVTTRSDPEQRRTVFERLPRLHHGRWIAVGRLDINTQGLLLLTNDGALAHALMHPGSGVVREYAVRIHGQVSPEILDRLATGVVLEDGPARFQGISEAGGDGVNRWYRVQVAEGRHRLVRRLWESQQLTVNRLIRTRYGTVQLPRWLSRGKVQELDTDTIAELAAGAGLPPHPDSRLRVVSVHPRQRRRSTRRKR